jgi:NADPH-dependent 2,4-dienoyl-CoA reductase/sulfur reductase-like enzyme
VIAARSPELQEILMPGTETIAIVGAGVAGVTAAGTLRDAGFTGRVLLISEERPLPYDRPPLSKAVLVHDEFESLVAEHLPGDIALRAPANIGLRPDGWYESQRIELLCGRRVVAIRTHERQIELDDSSTVSWDKLILAPGARARRLPAAESGPVPHVYLRTLSDAIQLRRRLRPGCRVVLLGGGVIGMEVAASAVLRDCDVTVAELAPRIMSRGLPAGISEHLAAYHLAKGVKLRLGVRVRGQAADTPGLALEDGSSLPADVIVIGIGVVPNVELATAAGIACSDGIQVDEFGATSALGVFAAGDAVCYPDSFLERTTRSENWMHAQNQAAAVARNVLGANEPYRQTPYMWSDQYDLKIQTTGRFDTEVHVTRGDPARNKFMFLHLEGGRVVGAAGINEPRDLKFAQRLIEAGNVIPPDRLADPAFNLKSAAAA